MSAGTDKAGRSRGRVLCGRDRATRAGGGTADTGGEGVSTRTALACSGLRDHRRGYAALVHGCGPSGSESAVGAAGMSAARGGMILR